jgi:exodeoxyribonuclease V alpha subunit
MKTAKQRARTRAAGQPVGNDPLDDPAFPPLARHFGRFIERLSGRADAPLALAAALVVRQLEEGGVCLDLRAHANAALPQDVSGTQPGFEDWAGRLRASGVVGAPGEFKPLVLDASGRLYLHRYWEYEQRLAAAIRQRAGEEAQFDPALAAAGLARLFPVATGSGAGAATDWQRVAAFAALRKKFCVITGGPGTGKTRTAAAILSLWLEQAGERPLRVALAAPTGKAAARLQESIRAASPPASGAASFPIEAFTLHRLLGFNPATASFRYDADNRLSVDAVVVDEASMVDLPLLARLFDALPVHARVVLLGDKDQLASVEAGAVFGDLCRSSRSNAFSLAFREQVRELTGESLPPTDTTTDPAPLRDCLVQLEKNHRFAPGSGLQSLSRAVNAGDVAKAVELLRANPRLDGLAAEPTPPTAQLKAALREPLLAGFADLLRVSEPAAALAALGRFRVLCALRQGPYGVEAINRQAEEIFEEAGLVRQRGPFYSGRPVLVTQNDYDLKLFNGDTGVLLPDAAAGGALRTWFASADGGVRGVPPARLPRHETAFAMTVHKGQGSEFERVLFLLPDRDSPVLARELVYTAVTRASRGVEVWFREPILAAALGRSVARASGLVDALREGPTGSAR